MEVRPVDALDKHGAWRMRETRLEEGGDSRLSGGTGDAVSPEHPVCRAGPLSQVPRDCTTYLLIALPGLRGYLMSAAAGGDRRAPMDLPSARGGRTWHGGRPLGVGQEGGWLPCM